MSDPVVARQALFIRLLSMRSSFGCTSASRPGIADNHISLSFFRHLPAGVNEAVFDVIICIKKNHPFATMNRYRSISGSVDPAIFLFNENNSVVADTLNNTAGTIARAIVDNDNFDNNIVFAEDFTGKTLNGLCGVIDRDNDADIDHGLLVLLNECHLIFVPFDRDFSSFPDF